LAILPVMAVMAALAALGCPGRRRWPCGPAVVGWGRACGAVGGWAVVGSACRIAKARNLV
jgi:hypothetical protein